MTERKKVLNLYSGLTAGERGDFLQAVCDNVCTEIEKKRKQLDRMNKATLQELNTANPQQLTPEYIDNLPISDREVKRLMRD